MKKEPYNCTLRLEKDVNSKIVYIAEYECRNRSQELIKLIKERIRTFEAEHGEISLPRQTEEE